MLWKFSLYLYLGNSHVLVAVFDFVYYPGPGFTKGLKQKIVITLREKS